jgi:plasmid stabilization system protein ParE
VTPLRLHEEAAAEYLEAVRWYRPRSPEAARRFRAAVGAAIALVRESPERWGLVPRVPQQFAIRRVLVKYFPYSVVYMVHDAEVVVLVVSGSTSSPRQKCSDRRSDETRDRVRPKDATQG